MIPDLTGMRAIKGERVGRHTYCHGFVCSLGSDAIHTIDDEALKRFRIGDVFGSQ